jgi:hypothetical protein
MLASEAWTRALVWATNSGIDPMRIGSGRTTTVAPASHVASMAVTSARDVGPAMATWSPGASPLAWRRAAMARASSYIWAHGTRSSLPRKVRAPDDCAAVLMRFGR